MRQRLRTWAHWSAQQLGEPVVFFLVLFLSGLWIGWGVWYGYSEGWQNWMDIPATLVPFLMLFLLQMSQNFESKATHTKLDELILSLRETDDNAAELEESDEETIDQKRNEQKSRLRNSMVE